MKLDKALGIAVSLTVLIGAVVMVENRYAQSADLDRHIDNSQVEFLEMYIQRAQDRLDSIQSKPAPALKDWERKEILRLGNMIERYKREIDREMK